MSINTVLVSFTNFSLDNFKHPCYNYRMVVIALYKEVHYRQKKELRVNRLLYLSTKIRHTEPIIQKVKKLEKFSAEYA